MNPLWADYDRRVKQHTWVVRITHTLVLFAIVLTVAWLFMPEVKP